MFERQEKAGDPAGRKATRLFCSRLRPHRMSKRIINLSLKEVDVPVVGNLHAGVAKELRDDLDLHTPSVEVTGEGVPQRVQPAVLHARRLAGLLHRGQ